MTDTLSPAKSKRLISLDALRGFTIADLIFPFFLFIVGVSIALAYSKRVEASVPKKSLYRKIIIRAINIYLLGLFLWLWPEFDFSSIRWVGVLQRISFVFLVCALLFLNTSWKQQIKIGAAILVLYYIIIAYIPVPGIGKLYLSVKDENKRLVWLFFVGFAMFLAGGLWNWFFPINKNLWTSSFVLYTAYAVIYMLIIFIPALIMYRKKIFIKV